MNSRELRIILAKAGCTFSSRINGSNHIMVEMGNRTSQIPMHAGGRDLGDALVEKIFTDLGISPWQVMRSS